MKRKNIILESILLCLTMLNFSVEAEIADSLHTNLPIVCINTLNQKEVMDEPKMVAFMYIINKTTGLPNSLNDTLYLSRNQIRIELRGNSTQNMPKKPYLIEISDSLNNDLDISMLGMPAENEWILLPSYLDRTQIRTSLAHHLSRALGEWSSNSRYCELVVNNEYMGIYLVIEKIERKKNRLNLSKLTIEDTSEIDITGGYIYEVTGFGGDMGKNRSLHYPKPKNVTAQQLDYIINYDNEFRRVMQSATFNDNQTGYTNWINIESFINEIIVQECMRNSDAYGWSAYFHKDKNDKLNAGPVWDFDQSSGNSTYLNGGLTKGWVLDYGTDQPFFWKKLFNDPQFKYALKLKWEKMRAGQFKTDSVLAFIDSCAQYINEAQVRNFTKWPILGTFIWRETAGYESRNSYVKEVDYLKDYISKRFIWIDEQLKDVLPVRIENKAIATDNIKIFPNPTLGNIYIQIPRNANNKLSFELFDLTGRKVFNEILTADLNNLNSIELSSKIKSGTYIYIISENYSILSKGKLIVH